MSHIYIYICHICLYIICIHVYMYTCKSHVSLPNVLAEGYAGCFIRQAVKPPSFTGMTQPLIHGASTTKIKI